MGADLQLRQQSLDWVAATAQYQYTYNFSWLGRPIIQRPEDIVATQEIIWAVKPELVVETGIAHGGSIVLSASILQLLGRGQVVGIDIDIRAHNRRALEEHPLRHRMHLIEGSSIAPEIVAQVRTL